MKAGRLTICDWHLRGRTDTVLEQPTWSDIEKAIKALNNRNLNDIHIVLDGRPDSYLVVGGGGGKYILSASPDGQSSLTITDPSVPEKPHVDLVVGGQLADFPGCHVVGLDRALAAVRAAVETGHFTVAMGWTEI